MVRLYADEDVFAPLVEHLRQLGVDVLTTRDAGRANRGLADEDQLRYATELGRSLLTHNRRHFRRLHRLQPSHAGIVAVSQTLEFAREARRLRELLEPLGSLAGRFVCLDLPAG